MVWSQKQSNGISYLATVPREATTMVTRYIERVEVSLGVLEKQRKRANDWSKAYVSGISGSEEGKS